MRLAGKCPYVAESSFRPEPILSDLLIYLETGSDFVAPAGLQLLTISLLSTGIKGEHHHTGLNMLSLDTPNHTFSSKI